MVWIKPLDMKTIVIDYFLGSTEFFVILLILVISSMSAKFRMSTGNFLMLLTISSLIFASYLGQAMYILILILIGFISFKSLSRLFD